MEAEVKSAQAAWMGADEARGQALIKDVHALFRKFEVPDKRYFDFLADIAGPSSEEGE